MRGCAIGRKTEKVPASVARAASTGRAACGAGREPASRRAPPEATEPPVGRPVRRDHDAGRRGPDLDQLEPGVGGGDVEQAATRAQGQRVDGAQRRRPRRRHPRARGRALAVASAASVGLDSGDREEHVGVDAGRRAGLEATATVVGGGIRCARARGPARLEASATTGEVAPGMTMPGKKAAATGVNGGANGRSAGEVAAIRDGVDGRLPSAPLGLRATR